MKKILVIHYSQTGQLTRILNAITAPLSTDPEIQLTFETIWPANPYPYPWNLIRFLEAMPTANQFEKIEIEPLKIRCDENFDLIILGYQPWYLSPSPPVSSFLQSPEAEALFRDRPVITIIGCRGMWLMAQEKMKCKLSGLGAHLIDNAVLVDQGGAMPSLLTTPNWLLRGKKEGYRNVIPEAGISEKDIADSARFGVAIRHGMRNDYEKKQRSMLKGYGAVTIDDKLFFPEIFFNRMFTSWAKMIQSVSRYGPFPRQVGCALFGIWLVCTVAICAPTGFILGPLIAPFYKRKIQELVSYFEKPSGSTRTN